MPPAKLIGGLLTVLLAGATGCASSDLTRDEAILLLKDKGEELAAEGKYSEYRLLLYNSGSLRFMTQVGPGPGITITRMFFEKGSPSYYLETHEGCPHGRYYLWHSNGTLRECGGYRNGTPDGVWKQFRSDGVLIGYGTLGEPVGRGGSVAASHPESPLSLGLPTVDSYRKNEDWVLVK